MQELQHWVVFNTETGAPIYRQSGDQPNAALIASQTQPPGRAVVVVPIEAFDGDEINLDLVKQAVMGEIDAKAEACRMRFITAGTGQGMTYIRKEMEARAWMEDNSKPTPFLSAEAAATGTTVLAAAQLVISQADAWVYIGSAIEGLRMGAKAAVAEATNIGQMVAAKNVDWDSIGV
jgi:hypothetical protein